MKLALQAAKLAELSGDVPVGAVVVGPKGEILATSGNERETRKEPTAHAEILSLQVAAKQLGSWRLAGCELYVTLEPCAMCAGAIVLARLKRVIIGAMDPKAGAGGSVFQILNSEKLNHRVEIVSGVLAAESSFMLRHFFTQRRTARLDSTDGQKSTILTKFHRNHNQV